MDFLSNLLVVVGSFFGFGEPVVAVVPTEPVVEEVVLEQDNEPVQVAVETQEQESGSVVVSEVIDPVMNEKVQADGGVNNSSEGDGAVTEELVAEAVTLKTEPATVPQNIQTMLVAGGCFWCVEADLEKVPGVIEVVSGYSGGTADNPTYQNYGSGGHREVVEVTYDANQVSFEDILIVTMKTTDPTDDDGTFADRGDKYSSAFYYENPTQKEIIEKLIAEVDEKGPYDKPLAIDVEPRAKFWAAEDYHQNYYKGTLSKLKYGYYRNASGRNEFIEKYWGVNDHSPTLPWRTAAAEPVQLETAYTYAWANYQKPTAAMLKEQLDELTYKVTQKDGTERAGSSPLDKNWEAGIYVDVLSGEPLFSSKDKFDSGTGWPSFVRPITPEAVLEHEDKKLFVTRTEIRSAIADNHLGHVFNDGPTDSTGLRYCMNGVALKFVPKSEMEAAGYADFMSKL